MKKEGLRGKKRPSQLWIGEQRWIVLVLVSCNSAITKSQILPLEASVDCGIGWTSGDPQNVAGMLTIIQPNTMVVDGNTPTVVRESYREEGEPCPVTGCNFFNVLKSQSARITRPTGTSFAKIEYSTDALSVLLSYTIEHCGYEALNGATFSHRDLTSNQNMYIDKWNTGNQPAPGYIKNLTSGSTSNKPQSGSGFTSVVSQRLSHLNESDCTVQEQGRRRLLTPVNNDPGIVSEECMAYSRNPQMVSVALLAVPHQNILFRMRRPTAPAATAIDAGTLYNLLTQIDWERLVTHTIEQNAVNGNRGLNVIASFYPPQSIPAQIDDDAAASLSSMLNMNSNEIARAIINLWLRTANTQVAGTPNSWILQTPARSVVVELLYTTPRFRPFSAPEEGPTAGLTLLDYISYISGATVEVASITIGLL